MIIFEHFQLRSFVTSFETFTFTACCLLNFSKIQILGNALKMAAKHPKIRIFEKLNKQQAVKVKVSKDVTKDRSWKCSKIIINVAYTNRPILSF